MSGSVDVASPRGVAAAWRVFAAIQAGLLLAASALLALEVRSECLHPPPPVERPDPGTPRAAYCAVVHASALWLLLVAAPVALLIAWFALPVARRRPGLGWLVLAAVLVALSINLAVVDSLQSAYTI